MENSTIVNETKASHECPVLMFNFADTLPHPDPETTKLRVWNIPGESSIYVLNTADWENYSGKVIWAPPDTLLPVSDQRFAFLAPDAKYGPDSIKSKTGGYYLMKAKRLRGEVSFGLMTKYDGSLEVGENGAAEIGAVHFDSEANEQQAQTLGGIKVKFDNGQVASPPAMRVVKYDIDSILKDKFLNLMVPGEPVVVSLKYHGECLVAVNKDGKLNVGSKNNWYKEFSTAPNITVEELVAKGVEQEIAQKIYDNKVAKFKPETPKWWTSLRTNPGAVKFLEENEGHCIYGESINTHGKFTYGLPAGQIGFVAFDILKPDGKWMDSGDFIDTCLKYGIKTVEYVSMNMPFDFEKLKEMVNGRKQDGCPCCEGFVIGPVTERYHPRLGRIKLKLINPEYHLLK